MLYLDESYISKLSKNRLSRIRRAIIGIIHKKEKDGWWCCELKCEWIPDENHSYPQEEKNRDYAYRDLVNKYYDKRNQNESI